MYEESRSGFPIKKVILAILVIVIIFFILMWLFPTKGYLSNNSESASVTKTFSENIELIKDAAMGYYTDERLPENTGDTEKMTLNDMIDLHLITEPVDSNNERCDLEKSYVEITKEETEYLMKINLSCNDKTDYIRAHMGSYTYCVGDICEKKNLTNDEEPETASEENPEASVATASSSSSSNNSSGSCKFVKSVLKYTSYGSWSGWTKTKVNASNTRNVQTKTVSEQTGTKTQVSTVTARYKATKQVINNKTVYICGSSYKNKGRYAYEVACLKDISTYKEVPVYSNVTYYRYQDRKAYYDTDVKWASCNSSLSGYRKAS